MGQAQSGRGVSTNRPPKEKVRKETSGKALDRFLHLFSLLTCIRPKKRKSAKSEDDTASESSLSADCSTRGRKGRRRKKGRKTTKENRPNELRPKSPTVIRVHPVSSSGPLVLYRPVWLPRPSPMPMLHLTHAGKLLLSILVYLHNLTFFMAPVWLTKFPKLYLTLAGKRTLEALTLSKGQPVVPEPDQKPEEEIFEKDLPLLDTWNGSDFTQTRRYTGRLQTLEEVVQRISLVMADRVQLWWKRQVNSNILTPEGSVAASTFKQEVTGVQLLGRRISHVMSYCFNSRKDFFENGQEVAVTMDFEGFAAAGEETQETTWSRSYTASTFGDHPPPRSPHGSPHGSPHSSPPPPHFSNTPQDVEEDIVEEPTMGVPLMQSYFAYKGTTDFSVRLPALRSAFTDLTNAHQSLNYISHAGRMVLGELVRLNNQDVRQFQTAYDHLVAFINEPGNRPAILEEISQAGITQVNFIDLFFEMLLLGLLEGKMVHPAQRDKGFLHLLFGVIVSICPPGHSWNQRAVHFLSTIKSQMLSVMDAIFNLDLHVYGCPEILSGEVLEIFELQVEYLLYSVD